MSFRAAILLSADSKMALVVRSVFQHTELQGGVFMKPKVIKKALKDTIQAMTDCSWLFSARPGKDNTRNRKFPFQKVVSSILAVDGSDLQIAANPDDPDSYYPGVNGQKDYSLLHIIKMPTGAITRLTVNDFASAGKTGWIWSIILKKSRITFTGITRYAFKAMKTLLILLQMRLLPGSNRKLARDRSRHIGICFCRCDLF